MARKLGDAVVEVVGKLNEATFKDSQAKIAKAFHDVNVTAAVRLDAAKAQADLAKLAKKRNIDIGVSIDEAQKAVIDAKLDVLTHGRDAKIKPVVDTSAFGKLKQMFGMAGQDASQEFNKGIKGGGGGGGLMSPAVLVPAVTAGLAFLPGAMAIAGGAGAVALGAAFAIKSNKALQAQGKTLISGLESTMTGASQVLVKPISGAISEIQGELPTIGKLFGQTFSNAAPLVRPLTNMLLDLVTHVMPGFNALMHASTAPLTQFFNVAGKLAGSGLGNFFRSLAPGVAPSLSIITSLLRIITSLLPDIGQLASITSHLLAPAFMQLASDVENANKILGPFLGLVEKASEYSDKFGNSANKAGKSSGGLVSQIGHLAVGAVSAIGGVGLLNQGLDLLGKVTGSSSGKTDDYTNKVNANRVALINNIAALGKIGGASQTYDQALSQVVGKLNQQDQALQTADQDWNRYFGILGSGQAALSTVASDITNTTSALKQYGANSVQYRAAVDQQISDNETFVQALQAQVKAAGNTTAAQAQMKSAFLDAARAQLTTADSSKNLQDSLVLEARQAGINVTSWAQLKAQLDKGTGGINAASKASDNLSQFQNANTISAAKMSQAHVAMTAVLAQFQQRGALTAGQVKALSSAIMTNKGQVDNSSSAFEVFAGKLGVSKGKADDLWNSLKRAAGNYVANVLVKVSGGGAVAVTEQVAATLGAITTGTPTSAQVTAAQQRQNAGAGPTVILSANGSTKKHAAGIRSVMGQGPAGKDSVLATLAPGEMVVPTQHVSKFMQLAKDKGIPGFAAGGILGANASFSQDGSVGSSLSKIAEPKFTSALGSSVGAEAAKSLSAAMKSEAAAGIRAAQAAAAALAGIGSGPAGGATGSEMANGRELYNYLLSNVFGGAKIAAAGAIASIWGESTWNPFAQGTGGRGLIGWTPPGTISDAAFSGGMKTQEPAIIRFINTSGDWGVINRMKGASSILEAANLWGKGVERYGINDVHSAGLALAAQIMGNAPLVQQGSVVANKKTGIATSTKTGQQTFNGYSYAKGGIVPGVQAKIASKWAQIEQMRNTIASLEHIKHPTRTQKLSLANDRIKLGLYDSQLGKLEGTSAANAEATAKARIAAQAAAADQARILEYGTHHSHSWLAAKADALRKQMTTFAKRGNTKGYLADANMLNDIDAAMAKWPTQLNAQHDANVSARNFDQGQAAKYLHAGNLKEYMAWNQRALGEDSKIAALDKKLAGPGPSPLAPGSDPISRMSNELFSSGLLKKLAYQLDYHSLDPAPTGKLSAKDMSSLALRITPDALQAIYDKSPIELASALKADLSSFSGIGDVGTTLKLLGKASNIHAMVSGHAFKLGGILPEKVLGIGQSSGMPFSFGAGERVVPQKTTGSDNKRLEDLLLGVLNELKNTSHNTRMTAANTGGTNKTLGGVGRGMF